jgi:acyl-coenzyme A synthetase/AMP-(fatty) acid ligase
MTQTNLFPACPAPFNMAEYVLRAGLQVPDKTALEVLGGGSWSYREIRQAVTSMAGGLQGLGLPDGARVLFRLGNRVEFPIAYLACIWAGLIPVPTSAQLNEAEISKIANDLSPDLIFAEDSVACPSSSARVMRLDELFDLQQTTPCPANMGDPNRLAYIIFTSGTSGTPRGVCHAHRAIWARQMMFGGWYGLRNTDRMLHAGAFNWSYTMGTGLMDPWTVGATALIPPEGMPVTKLAQAISGSNPTIFAAAPGVYRQLLRADDLVASQRLRHGLSAGEALAPSLRLRWRDLMGCDIHEALGMSECSTFISGSPDNPAPMGTSGRAQIGRSVAVLDASGKTSSIGELAVNRNDPGLMIGYLNEVPLVGDWFRTGDTAALSEDGWITYLGRNDDIMTAGGYRISPLEVEAAFANNPLVKNCAAAQVRTKVETTLIALFYESDEEISDTDLRNHAQSMLAKYKQPHLYIPCATLPKGANGKINRKLLRTRFEADL